MFDVPMLHNDRISVKIFSHPTTGTISCLVFLQSIQNAEINKLVLGITT